MRYPLVKQDELKNCGPCSLATIILYYKGYIKVDTLSDMMHTTKNGTTAYDLIEVARKIGFEASGLKVNINDLRTKRMPCIAHVTLNKSYNHFIVVYKVLEDKILIGDPLDKIKYITYEEFNNIWNNIIVELKPIRILPKIKEKSLLFLLKNILVNNIPFFLLIVSLNLVYVVISLIYTLLIKYIIDNITLLNNTIFIIFLIIILMKVICLYIRNKVIILFNKKISLSITNDVISSIISLPYPYYRNHQTGEIISRINDLEYVKNFISELFLSILEFPELIVFLFLMFSINHILFYLILIVLILYILINYYLATKIKNTINEYLNQKALFNSKLVESISGFETIKGLNIENKTITSLNDYYLELEKTIHKYNNLCNIKDILIEILSYLGTFLIIIYGLYLFNNSLLQLGSIIIYYVLFNYLLEPISTIININIRYKQASNSYCKIQFVFSDCSISKKQVNNYDIYYKNLSFNLGYKKLLNNIILKIKYGDKVFITGKSGNGKSTLVKLIKGYYKTSNLYLGDDEVSKCNLDNIVYISQNEVLFSDTIRNNLMVDDIKGIDKLCLINNDLNTYVEENGFNLSGGEKEKIVLARSLLHNFKVLIIDEGLSEIDINQERTILKNIFKEYKDKTIIVISHRLDNFDLFNHYIEISNGQVIKDEYKCN